MQNVGLTSKQTEHISARLLKDKIATNSSGGEGSHSRNEGLISLSQHRGKPLTVNIAGATRNSQVPSISANSLRQMQTDIDLSSRKVLRIAAFIRAETNSPAILEPNYQKKYITK